MERPEIPLSQRTFGEIVYWICIVATIVCMVGPVIALLYSGNNVMDPHYFFASIFTGSTAEFVWQEVGEGFPGGHFWVDHMFFGDGLTQFGVAIGCASALPALLATTLVFIFKKKERSFFWAFLSLATGVLIAISMMGIFSV